MTSLFRSVAWIAVLAFGLISLPASAANIPCKTAKLIVPWKAGGGTHVLFSIFEKTIQQLDVTPKIKVVTVPGHLPFIKVPSRVTLTGVSILRFRHSTRSHY